MPGIFLADCRVKSITSFTAEILGDINVMGSNLAAMTGLYSILEGNWWSLALSLCGVELSCLPELVQTGAGKHVPEHCRNSCFRMGKRFVMAGKDRKSVV